MEAVRAGDDGENGLVNGEDAKDGMRRSSCAAVEVEEGQWRQQARLRMAWRGIWELRVDCVPFVVCLADGRGEKKRIGRERQRKAARNGRGRGPGPGATKMVDDEVIVTK